MIAEKHIHMLGSDMASIPSTASTYW